MEKTALDVQLISIYHLVASVREFIKLSPRFLVKSASGHILGYLGSLVSKTYKISLSYNAIIPGVL